MSGVVSVKLQIGTDIRRFVFSGTSFPELKNQCLNNTQSALETEWVALYQDDEGEWITFSTDEELKYAISTLKGENALLRIKLQSTGQHLFRPLKPACVPSNTKGKDLDARFINHVSVTDDTPLTPGTRFVKTWKLRNCGTQIYLN